jgi:hypothetical protein
MDGQSQTISSQQGIQVCLAGFPQEDLRQQSCAPHQRGAHQPAQHRRHGAARKQIGIFFSNRKQGGCNDG